MRVAIIHDAVKDSDAPDAQDAIVQAEAVKEALLSLGHHAEILECSLNLEGLVQRLRDFRTDTVFNLVESLNGHGRLIHLPLFCLDAMGMPYTGACAESMLLTSHKIMAKSHMRANGLPTADWIGPYPSSIPYTSVLNKFSLPQRGRAGEGEMQQSEIRCCFHPPPAPPSREGGLSEKWIIKSVWEHASIGLDESGLVQASSETDILPLLKEKAPMMGGACFAERFIEGREFNLSLLCGFEGPEVLPPAEIIFQDYGSDRIRIVDYKAKWDPDSFAYHHTPRSFDFGPEDSELLERLKKLASDCWTAFGLSGYARVDFRVDEKGNPRILEVNANPCISPDAGFAAALEQAKIPFTEAVRRILADI